MIFSFLLIPCISFEPKCTANFGWDLWGFLSSLNCDGDALLTIPSQVITSDKWTNIGNVNNYFKGTLKIKGEGKVIVEGGFKITGWTKDIQNPNILKTTIDKALMSTNQTTSNSSNVHFDMSFVEPFPSTSAKTQWLKDVLLKTSGRKELQLVLQRTVVFTTAFYVMVDEFFIMKTQFMSDNFWDGINCWVQDSECDMKIEKNHWIQFARWH